MNKQIEDSKINNNNVKIYALILCHISYLIKNKPSTHMKISMAHEEPVTNTLNLYLLSKNYQQPQQPPLHLLRNLHHHLHHQQQRFKPHRKKNTLSVWSVQLKTIDIQNIYLSLDKIQHLFCEVCSFSYLNNMFITKSG